MTVADMIKRLQRLPKNLDVCIDTFNGFATEPTVCESVVIQDGYYTRLKPFYSSKYEFVLIGLEE